jgi:imidazolonepropionase-like amidohydrolase
MASVSAANRTVVMALLVLVAPAAVAVAQTCDSSPLVVRNVRVWTPEGPLAARDVVVERGRVTSVEPAGPERPGYRVLDGSGHTLLPGLVDSHLHFSVPGGLPGPGRSDTLTITARQLLYSGVPYRATQYRRNPAALAHPSNFRFFSPDDARFVLASARRDLDGETTTRTLGYAATLAAKLRELRTLGHPVAVGSDAGSPMHFQANAIWWEMEAWRAAGVAHREVLTAATVNGARVLRQADLGHLRPGARADFVLYRGDVEDGAFDVGRVIAVARGGVLMR